MDITQIGGHLNVCITMLTQRFVFPRRLAFGRGSKFLWPFLQASSNSRAMVYILANETEKFYILHEEGICNRPSTFEECQAIGAKYVQRVIGSLNERFPDLHLFNACKLFNPILYPTDDEERTIHTEQWLERLCDKFGISNIQ